MEHIQRALGAAWVDSFAEADGGLLRFALFDVIATHLRSLAASQPLLLVIDDLHWSDPPSLLMLDFVTKDPDSPFSIAPLARTLAACAHALRQLLEAYRSGGGVEWAAYGADMIESQGDFNRPWLRASLTQEYLSSVPDVHERLTAGAKVVDIASGVGWAGIAVAKGYPRSTVVGLDPDDSSITLARRFAAEEGVSDRTTFEVHDAAQPLPGGPYDLAIMVEALHDVARPVEILASVRFSLAPGGTMIVADEKVGETFTAPGDPVEAFMYGASILVCLPAAMTEQPTAATGTVMRPQTVTEYSTRAGFERVEVLEQIEHPMLRFSRLHA